MNPSISSPLDTQGNSEVTKFYETKRDLDGHQFEFDCELLHRDADQAILSYIMHRAYELPSIRFEEGCRTTALYQVGEPYVFWRIESPSGELLGYYIHLAANVSIGPDWVTWDDLTVDLWVHPDGSYEVWDEDELQRLRERGIIGEEQLRAVEETKQQMIENLAEIIASAKAKLATVLV